MPLPILYSFRRCPYAMRARLGLLFGQCQVEVREITLKAKPAEMLAISPKGTVPVLQLPTGEVIAESLDIMLWGLHKADSPAAQQLLGQTTSAQSLINELIVQNDVEFKPWLDKYKYADRYPEYSQADYFAKASTFLVRLEAQLQQHPYLISPALSVADFAIVPFIRQFTAVDAKRDLNGDFPRLMAWLTELTSTDIFQHAMTKYVIWQTGNTPNYLLGTSISK
ncbi:glutathione S-transferase [Shewanella sp. ZOR0012]|uniref:glutathione S-transferase n=1 Tax=Shewanella TaxID=22 RepID=UPI000647CFB5|nr:MULTISPECIES: glutathione S-transferase [Shewanella]MCT8868193.1 glutathione S-transferase [Shewanella xiamenensis]NSM24662.1 glutathione S-transferase [Shewanella sp. ZOR0012]